MRRPLLALVLSACSLGASAVGALGTGAGRVRVPSDPWPDSPVLLRLLTLPSARRDGERLFRALALSPAEAAELRRLAQSEASFAQAARQVIGRREAAQLNKRIAAMRVEKDRKVRALLGSRYPAFREWVREWWAGQVRAAGSR